jgi:hypothetical protein
MIYKHFCNALDNYILFDQMQSAIKLIQLATRLELDVIQQVLENVERDMLQNPYRNPHKPNRVKHLRKTIGNLIYTELSNQRNRYAFDGYIVVYKIKKFKFKQHFETI